MHLIEFKVVKAQHTYSKHKDKGCYAIVATQRMTAEPDAFRGVNLSNADDMFIIANDIVDAYAQLNQPCYVAMLD